ncbi:hypothetical protein P7C73_g3238, partial [Tremellales sp. Uapishka_1]
MNTMPTTPLEPVDAKTDILGSLPGWGSYLYTNFLLPALSPNILPALSPALPNLASPADWFNQFQQPPPAQDYFNMWETQSPSGPSNPYSSYYNPSIATSLLEPQLSASPPASTDFIDAQIQFPPSPLLSTSTSPIRDVGQQRGDSVDTDAEVSHDEIEEAEGVERDGMIWGMKVDDYRSLSARERKRVRNRISARTFRAKRKGVYGPLGASSSYTDWLPEHLNSLENTLNAKDQQIKSARDESARLKREVAELKRRLARYEKPYDRPSQLSKGSSF